MAYLALNTQQMVRAVKAGRFGSLTPMIREKAKHCWSHLPYSEQVVHSLEDLIAEGKAHCATHVVKRFNPKLHIKFSTFAYASLDNFYTDIHRAAHAEKRTVKVLSLDTTNTKSGISLAVRLTRMNRYERSEEEMINRIDAERAFVKAYNNASKLLRRYMIRWILQPNEGGRCKPGDKFNQAHEEFSNLWPLLTPALSVELCEFIQNDLYCRTAIADKLVLRAQVNPTLKRKTKAGYFTNAEEYILFPDSISPKLRSEFVGA